MNRSLLVLGGLVLVAGLVGCGDDDGGSSTSNTGGSNTGGTGNDGGSGGTGNTSSNGGSGGTGNTSSNGGAGNAGGSGGSGGSGGTGGSGLPDASTFCAEYEATCGYGTGYTDEADCIDKYDNVYDDTRRECVNTHVGLAASDTATHCPHAAGAGPCS